MVVQGLAVAPVLSFCARLIGLITIKANPPNAPLMTRVGRWVCWTCFFEIGPGPLVPHSDDRASWLSPFQRLYNWSVGS